MEPWLTRAARMHPARAALVAPERTWTYAALHDAARSAGGALLARGVRPGDRVALQMGSEELVVALHGCLLIGAIAVPVDLRLAEAERHRRRDGAVVALETVP